jgi:hypothetical protein
MIFLLFQSAASAASVIRPITVNINGHFINADSPPFIDSGRVMIPVRVLASLGLTYSWDAGSKTATVTNSANDVFKMVQAQSTAYKNGQPVKMDVPANNYQGRIMVPARFVSEAFDFNVLYEKTRGILFVQSKDYKPDLSKLVSSNLQEARLAAISLPITYSFTSAPLADTDKYLNYTYTFPAGDSSRYTYSNSMATTVIEVTGGVARAVWQFTSVGTHSTNETLAGQSPAYIAEMFHDTFDFFDGKYKGYYLLSDGSTKSYTYTAPTYGDIIQSIPGQ